MEVRRVYHAPTIRSTNFSRPFVVNSVSLPQFLRATRIKDDFICRSYVYDRNKQELGFGNLDQATFDQRQQGTYTLAQTHHELANAIWPNDHRFNDLLGGFIDIRPEQLDCYAIRIFGYSSTYTAGEEGHDDCQEFDRAVVARKIINIAGEADLHLLSSDTCADFVRILIRIA